ncbi:MAG: hypothetical protein ACOYOE_10435 [Chlorobium sp.]
MRKNTHRKIDRHGHANNHGEGFVLADELEQGFKQITHRVFKEFDTGLFSSAE